MGVPFTALLPYRLFTSQVIPVEAGEIVLEVDPAYRHSFAYVSYYTTDKLDELSEDNIVLPTDGEETFTIKPSVNPHGAYTDFLNNLHPVSSNCPVSWAANVDKVKVNFSGVTIAPGTFAVLRVASNIS